MNNNLPNLVWIVLALLVIISITISIMLLIRSSMNSKQLKSELDEQKKKDEETTKKIESLTKEKSRLLSELASKSAPSPQEEKPQMSGDDLAQQNKELVFLTKDYLITDFLGLVKQYFPLHLDFSQPAVNLGYEQELRFNQMIEQLDRIEKLSNQYGYRFPLEYYQRKMIYSLGLRNFGQLESILKSTLSFYPQNKEHHLFHIRLLSLMYRDKEALEQCSSFLETYPGEIEAREILVGILLRQHQLKKAEIECRKLMELKLDNTYRAQLAFIYLLQGFIAKSEEICEELARIQENDFAQFYLGRIDENRGKSRDALTRYQKLYQSGNRDQSMIARLIDLNSQLGQSHQNRKYFEEMRSVADLDAQLCLAYIKSTEFSKMEFSVLSDMMKTLCHQREKDHLMYDAYGELLLRHQDFANARIAFATSLEIQPDGKQALIHLVQLDIDEKDFKTSKDRLDRLLELYPDDKEILVQQGIWQAASGDQENARKTFTAVAESEPGKLSLYPLLGTGFMRIQDFKEALFYFIRLEDAKQRSENLFRDMAFCYYSLNQYEDALTYYHKVLDVNSKNLDALNNIGVIHSERSEFKKAKKYFHEALDLNPDAVQTNYNLALLYRKINQENSVKYYARYKELIKEGVPNGQNH